MAFQKVIQIFLSFTPDEQGEFKKILNQQATSKKTTYSQTIFKKLCDLQKNGRKDWEKEDAKKKFSEKRDWREMSPEQLSQYIFKVPPHRILKSKNTYAKRYSELVQLMTDYLLAKKLEGESDLKTRLLLEVFKERRLNNLANNLLEKEQEKLTKGIEKNQIEKSIAVYEQFAYLKRFELNYPATDQNRKKKNAVHEIHELEGLIQTLKTLQDCCSLLMRKVEHQSKDKKLQVYLDERTYLIDLHKLEEHELVQLYQQAIQLLTNFKEQDYWRLKQMWAKHKPILSKEEQSRFLKYLINASCMLYLNTFQRERYLQEIYALYETGFSEEIFIYDGFLNTDIIINHIVISVDYRQWLKNRNDTIVLSQLPDLHTIIIDNVDKLYEDDKELTVILATAYASYSCGNYERALDLIHAYMQKEVPKDEEEKEPKSSEAKNKIQIADDEDKKPKSYRTIANKLRIRSLKLRIYYEQGNINGFLTWSKWFSRFLDDNKVGFSEPQKTAHLNFIQLINDIFEGKRPKDVLLEQIKNQKPLACRNWLTIQLLTSIDSESGDRDRGKAAN